MTTDPFIFSISGRLKIACAIIKFIFPFAFPSKNGFENAATQLRPVAGQTGLAQLARATQIVAPSGP